LKSYIFLRIIKKGFKITRYKEDVGKYKMVIHGKDNPDNPDRFQLLDESVPRIDTEGLNTINYNLKSVLRKKLFTHIVIDYDQDKILQTYFNRNQKTKQII
jgi:hypothetical protein